MDTNTDYAIDLLETYITEQVTEPRIYRVYAIADTQDGAEPKEYDITGSQLLELIEGNHIDTFLVGRVSDD